MRPARSTTCSTTRASCSNSSCSSSSCSNSSCCWWSHRQLRSKVAVATSRPLLLLLTMLMMMTVVGAQPVAEAMSRWTLGTTVAAAAAAVPRVSPGSPQATPRPRGGPVSPGNDPEGASAEEDTSSDCPPLDDDGGADDEDDVVRNYVDAAGQFVDDIDDDDDVGAGVDDNCGNDDVRADADREDDDIEDDDDGDDGGGGGGPWSTADATCNISLTPGTTGLQARWSGTGSPPCDLHIFSTNPGRASSFSTSFTRVRSPLLLERHLGEDDGHGYRACVSCAPTASLGLRARPFCCRDISRAEVYLCPGCGGEGARVRDGGRGPLEAAVVACFMTAVLTVWVVAALVWPVPIIAEFLPSLLTEPRGRRVTTRR
ncbi:transmembrane protein 158 [Petromyzon marinus]|uniref:transmembrane protein 158 n=1 Tax=Petromyzon marinus TaxID=7757 RepID=UPI003F71977B